jgi:hypothetical protein
MEDYGFGLDQYEIEEEYWGKDWNNPVNGDASEEDASQDDEVDAMYWHHSMANYHSAWAYSSPKSWLGVP